MWGHGPQLRQNKENIRQRVDNLNNVPKREGLTKS